MVEPLRFTQVEVLSIMHTRIVYIDKGTFDDLPFLTTINLSNNEHLGLAHAIHAFDGLTGTPLTSMVLDKCSTQVIDALLDYTIFCDYIGTNIERLTLRGYTLLSVSGNIFKCFKHLKVLSLEFSTILLSNDPTDGIYVDEYVVFSQIDSYKNFQLNLDKLLPHSLEVLDVSHMFDVSSGYAKKYSDCFEPRHPGCYVQADDYFPPYEWFHNEYSQYTGTLSENVSNSLNSDATSMSNVSRVELMRQNVRFVTLPPNLKYVYGTDIAAYGTTRSEHERNWHFTAESLLLVNISGSFTFQEALSSSKHSWVEGLDKLGIFDLSNIGLDHIDTSNVTANSLQILILSHNRLGLRNGELEPGSFQKMKNLRVLDLSHNMLSTFSIDLLENLSQLRKLDISNNRLSLGVAKEMAINHYMYPNVSVHLARNAFVCACNVIEEVVTLQNHLQYVFDRDDLTCLWEGNQVNISELNIGWQCGKAYRAAGAASAVLILTFISVVTIAIVLVRRHWSNIVLLYYTFKWNRKKRQMQFSQATELLGHQTELVAYVIYNSSSENDRHFVQQTLRNKVEEEWNINLFIPERNSAVGGPRGDTILSDMDKCQCYIIVSSLFLLEDDWADYTLQQAANIRRPGLRSKVCIIRLGRQPCRKSIPKEFRPLLYPHSLLPVPVLELREQGDDNKPFWDNLEKYLVSFVLD